MESPSDTNGIKVQTRYMYRVSGVSGTATRVSESFRSFRSFRDCHQNEQIANAMIGYQPRTAPSYGYDGSYSPFQGAGSRIFGYDLSENSFGTIRLEALSGYVARFGRFTGKERDSESGLDYFGARYYGSALGRFTSPDPLMATPERLLDPQEWNLYGYARNNPLSITDPTGLDIWLQGCGKDSSTCQGNYVGNRGTPDQ